MCNAKTDQSLKLLVSTLFVLLVLIFSIILRIIILVCVPKKIEQIKYEEHSHPLVFLSNIYNIKNTVILLYVLEFFTYYV